MLSRQVLKQFVPIKFVVVGYQVVLQHGLDVGAFLANLFESSKERNIWNDDGITFEAVGTA